MKWETHLDRRSKDRSWGLVRECLDERSAASNDECGGGINIQVSTHRKLIAKLIKGLQHHHCITCDPEFGFDIGIGGDGEDMAINTRGDIEEGLGIVRIEIRKISNNNS